ncbi:IstB-like ATP binding family protein [Candidatus Desulfosporosinus infrequens]|uniref:IstB-like ATP binding family protein n=1 Tax=Candidatus Desulfosporosinus infrequens TaxID=2043169 RepID=A0A2U3LDX6_9FIRM|nr:IstB-like ATP binding family protein [Candidatus Desulfosporosinus infrequens]
MRSVKDILKSNVLAAKPLNADLKFTPYIDPDYPIADQNDEMTTEQIKPAETLICPICQDRGIIIEGDVAYPCNCMRMRKIENQFRHARISRVLKNCRLEKFRFDFYGPGKLDQTHSEGATKALNAARSFVEECQQNPHGLGILFTGPVGSGKTYLAASIANELIEAQLQVLFLVVPDLLDELRASYKSEVNEMDLLDTARTIPILILDDLGAHNYTDWTRNRLYSIINYRMNELLPTVITSNLSLDEMEDYIGVRTTSRIIQSSRIFRLTVEEDIRHQIYDERERK